MASPKKVSKAGRITVRFRGGDRELYVTVDSVEEVDLVGAYEVTCQASGVAPTKAGALEFVRNHRSFSPKEPAKAGSATASKMTVRVPWQGRQAELDRKRAEQMALHGDLTLAEFIGHPLDGEPGPFFAWHKPIRLRSQTQYEYFVRGVWKRWAGWKMREFSVDVLYELRAELFACSTCGRQAIDPSPTCESHLYDGSFTDNWKKFSYLRKVLEVFMMPDVRDVQIGRQVKKLAKRPHKPSVALDSTVSEAIIAVAAADVRALLMMFFKVGFRLSELMALNRCQLYADEDSEGWVAIDHNMVRNPVKLQRVQGVKTDVSQAWMTIPDRVWQALLTYIAVYRSKPSPAVCAACRAGDVFVVNRAGGPPNPHQGCAMADDAPLFIGRRGKRITVHYVRKFLDEAVAATGLPIPHVTIKDTRATFATQLAMAGFSPRLMALLGRWFGEMVQVDSYTHLTPKMQRDLLECADLQQQMEFDIEQMDERRVRALLRQVLDVSIREGVRAALTAIPGSTEPAAKRLAAVKADAKRMLGEVRRASDEPA